MTIAMEYSQRPSQYPLHAPLEDRFEVLKEIGDGSFGSVVLARTRTAGSNVARRGTLVSFTLVAVVGSIDLASRSPSRL